MHLRGLRDCVLTVPLAAGPTSFPPATKANKWENLYYAVEVPGEACCGCWSVPLEEEVQIPPQGPPPAPAPKGSLHQRSKLLWKACHSLLQQPVGLFSNSGLCLLSPLPSGMFKAIHITSFSFEQPMKASEEQYIWLQAELAKVSCFDESGAV